MKFTRARIMLLILGLVSCSQTTTPETASEVIRKEKLAGSGSLLFREHLFHTDPDQKIDEYRFYLFPYREGPFPKLPIDVDDAERLDSQALKKYSKLKISYDSIEKYYLRVVALENYFRDHPRDPKYVKGRANQDIYIQSGSDSSHALQFLLYKTFATFKSNRWEMDPGMNPKRGELYADPLARSAMNQHLHELCEKHGYTLTAFLWSGEESIFRSAKAIKQGTEALQYHLANHYKPE